MSQFISFKKTLRILILTLVVTLFASVFQNCGGQRAFYARQAFIPLTIIEEELIQLHSATMSPQMCRENRYHCQHKLFSPEAQNAEAEAYYKCVMVEGVQICPIGRTFTYNSAAAESACAENCDEYYSYEEYICHFDLATSDGIYPLQAVAATLDDAVSATYAACIRAGEAAQARAE